MWNRIFIFGVLFRSETDSRGVTFHLKEEKNWKIKKREKSENFLREREKLWSFEKLRKIKNKKIGQKIAKKKFKEKMMNLISEEDIGEIDKELFELEKSLDGLWFFCRRIF